MSNFDLIDHEPHYKRLRELLIIQGWCPVERVLFLSVFESWFCFHFSLYLSLVSLAIECLEEDLNA